MKKYLIVLAAALVALVGCKEKEGDTYSSIKIKQAEIAIGVGESAKLNLLYEPTSLAAPQVKWSTSDADVATVDQNGNVTGVAIGTANITATLDKLTAVCKVTVKDAYDLIEWNGLAWWTMASKEPTTEDTIEVTLSNGMNVHCVPGLVYCRLWGEGITMNSAGTNIEGEGIDAFNLGMGLLIVEDLGNGQNGYVLGTNHIEFVDPELWDPTDTAFLFTAPAGVWEEGVTAEQNWKYWTSDYDTCAFYGSYLQNYNADSAQLVDPLIGLLKEGYWIGNDYVIKKAKADVEWFDWMYERESWSFAGILLDIYQDEETGEYYLDFADPMAWAETFITHYEFENAEEAPEYFAVAPRELPKRAILNERKFKDNKVLIKK